MRCNHCGSVSFRADRALGGRLVCVNCGAPEGKRALSKNKMPSFADRRKLYIILFFAVLFIILIL